MRLFSALAFNRKRVSQKSPRNKEKLFLMSSALRVTIAVLKMDGLNGIPCGIPWYTVVQLDTVFKTPNDL